MAKKRNTDIRNFFGEPKRKLKMPNADKAEGQKSGLDTTHTHTHTKAENHGHTFTFCYTNKPYTVICDRAMTVLQRLLTNKSFRRIYNQHKSTENELLIRRKSVDGPAVVTHFPCCLIDNDECVFISFIQNSETTPKPEPIVQSPEHLLCFYISTRGEKNIRRTMRSKELRRRVQSVCVYAMKAETMKAALERDGRFNSKVLRRAALRDDKTSTITDLSNPADHSNEKQFVVIIPPYQTNSQESSQESIQGAVETVTGKERKVCVDNQEEQPQHRSSTALEQKPDPPLEEQKGRKYPKVKQIPETEEILKLLREQHGRLLEVLKERETLKNNTDVTKFFRQEYDKSAQSFSEVKRVRKLVEFSDFVCQIRIHGSPVATGFLLFNRFVLTNAHVVKKCVTELKLTRDVKAAFNFEDLTSLGKVIAVKENVVAFSMGIDVLGKHLDFALLELSRDDEPSGDELSGYDDDDDKVPGGLLQYYSAPPSSGGVCIIGHPEGKVKQMDPCFIIPKADVPQAGKTHFENDPNDEALYVVTKQWGNESKELHETQFCYNSCFFHGSSGSPVFDEHCNLIGVHTGGYVYEGKRNKTRSVVEYALPMFPILVQIYIQCSSNERSKVVKYMESHQRLGHVVKEAKRLKDMKSNTVSNGADPEHMDTN